MYYAWLYFENRFKDVYLPDLQNWTGRIALLQSETGWQTDIYIPVRCLENEWYVGLPEGFSWRDAAANRGGAPFSDSGEERAWEDAEATTGNNEIHLKDHSRITMSDATRGIGLLFTECDKGNIQFEKYRMDRSRVSIGRSSGCDVSEDSSIISNEHGFISRADGGYNYTDRSHNGTYINGLRFSNTQTRLRFGDVLTFPSGLKIVFLGDVLAINYAKRLSGVRLTPLPDPVISDAPREEPSAATAEYHRSPRVLMKANEEPVNIEPPIPKSESNEQPLWMSIGPSATMVLPMFLGMMANSSSTGSTMASGLVMIATSSALAVGWGLVGGRYRKKQDTMKEGKRQRLYRTYIAEIEARLKSLNAEEYNRLLLTCPDITACAEFPVSGGTRLWERMPSHMDFMTVRLGRGDVVLPNKISTQEQKLSLIDDPLRNEPERLKSSYGTVRNAPFTLALREETVVGILGEQEATAHAQGILLQLAALHSYHDVRIAVLTDEGVQSRWSWTRRLPHVYANEDRQLRMVVSSPSAVQDVLNHLNEVLSMRKETMEANEKAEDAAPQSIPIPHYVVFCTNPKILENKPLLRNMLTNRWGMTLIMITKTAELLPKECHIMINPSQRPGALITSEGDSTPVEYEYPNQTMLDRFSKRMAPMRVNDSEESAAIPTIVPFLDVYHVRDVNDLDIWRFWNENQSYEGLLSTIGLGSGAQPFVLDISDNAHGPHGLLAGTTGSGKSVMLETYILSLAVNYHPDQVRFIIIDYKGGGMANTFRELPHVTGIVDNLQGERIISRALASLQGEIHRREHIFKNVGVNNIHDYVRLFGQSDTDERLPHLIIIVDEFAELISEQREFMQDLVSAARVGRSLGLHLILATQKPSNSVSDEIWANTNFRICLRVQTRSDSNEMLHRPDAAYIKQRGRCYVQVGNDEIFEQVQTCYSGTEYSPDGRLESEMPHLLSEAGQPIKLRGKAHAPNVKKETQMSAVLNRIEEVLVEHQVSPAPDMWQKELEPVIMLESLPGIADNRFSGGVWPPQSDTLSAIYGLADDVAGQRYLPLSAEIASLRNMMIVGLASTGKTTLIQTLAVSLALKYDPAHLQMYAFSLSTQTLGTLRALPHVGDVVFGDTVYETLRLIDLLTAEDKRRIGVLTAAATNNFQEYNRGQLYRNLPTMPSIVVFVDRIQQLREFIDDDDLYSYKFNNLVNEGSARGIYFIATAMRVNEFPYKIRDAFKGVALQLNDRGDCIEITGRRMPAEMPNVAPTYGRGIAAIDEGLYEMQVALYSSPIDVERHDRIRELGDEMSAAWTGARPKPVPRIPEKPTLKDFRETIVSQELPQDPLSLPLCYNLTTGLPDVLPLGEDFSFLFLGTGKSGKTNALKCLASHFAAQGAELIIYGKDEWLPFGAGLGVNVHTDPTTEEFAAAIANLQGEIRPRALKLKEARAKGPDEVAAVSREFRPIVLLLDDVDVFSGKADPAHMELLEYMTRDAAGFAIYLFAATSQQGYTRLGLSQFISSLVSQQRGVMLGGKIADCDPWNLRIPFQEKGKSLPAGWAYLIERDNPRQVVFPLASTD